MDRMWARKQACFVSYLRTLPWPIGASNNMKAGQAAQAATRIEAGSNEGGAPSSSSALQLQRAPAEMVYMVGPAQVPP